VGIVVSTYNPSTKEVSLGYIARPWRERDRERERERERQGAREKEREEIPVYLPSVNFHPRGSLG
jgi:hypothetical protein